MINEGIANGLNVLRGDQIALVQTFFMFSGHVRFNCEFCIYCYVPTICQLSSSFFLFNFIIIFLGGGEGRGVLLVFVK